MEDTEKEAKIKGNTGETSEGIEKIDFATDTVQSESSEKFPKSVGFIIGNEFCER